MAGRFSYADGTLYFAPRFPFQAGTSYRLRDHHTAHPSHEPTLRRPATPRKRTTRVLEIYPTGTAVPVNLLRCYLHFSAPMSEGHTRDSVHLIASDTGKPLPDALLPMDPELWDRSRTRLTLLLDPGRIKRGLIPHTETGYPLTQGGRVTLIVDDTFRDATGTAADRRLPSHVPRHRGPTPPRHPSPVGLPLATRAQPRTRPCRIRPPPRPRPRPTLSAPHRLHRRGGGRNRHPHPGRRRVALRPRAPVAHRPLHPHHRPPPGRPGR